MKDTPKEEVNSEDPKEKDRISPSLASELEKAKTSALTVKKPSKVREKYNKLMDRCMEKNKELAKMNEGELMAEIWARLFAILRILFLIGKSAVKSVDFDEMKVGMKDSLTAVKTQMKKSSSAKTEDAEKQTEILLDDLKKRGNLQLEIQNLEEDKKKLEQGLGKKQIDQNALNKDISKFKSKIDDKQKSLNGLNDKIAKQQTKVQDLIQKGSESVEVTTVPAIVPMKERMKKPESFISFSDADKKPDVVSEVSVTTTPKKR